MSEGKFNLEDNKRVIKEMEELGKIVEELKEGKPEEADIESGKSRQDKALLRKLKARKKILEAEGSSPGRLKAVEDIIKQVTEKEAASGGQSLLDRLEERKKQLEAEENPSKGRIKAVEDIIKEIKDREERGAGKGTEAISFPFQGETVRLLDEDGKINKCKILQVVPEEDKIVLAFSYKGKSHKRGIYKQYILTLAQFEELKKETEEELAKGRRRPEGGKGRKEKPEPKDEPEKPKDTPENPEDTPENPKNPPENPEGGKGEGKKGSPLDFRSILARARAEALKDSEAEKNIRFLKEMQENKEWVIKITDILEKFLSARKCDLDAFLKDLSDSCGLSIEEIKDLLEEEKELLRQQAEQEARADKSWGKYAKKTAGYMGAAGALLVLERCSAIFGLAGSVALSGARIIDSYKTAKKDKEKMKKFYRELTKNLQEGIELKKQKEEAALKGEKLRELSEKEKRLLEFAEKIQDNFAARVALKRQEKEKKKFFTKYEDENGREKVLREALERVLEGDDFKYLGDEEKEKIISLILQLDKIDRAQEKLKEKAAARLGGKWQGLKEKFRHFMEKIDLEGSSAREKALTSLVFSAAGYLAAEAPVLRQALYGYAGVKTGDMLAQFLTSRIRKKQEEEKDISSALKEWKEIKEEINNHKEDIKKKKKIAKFYIEEAEDILQRFSAIVADEELARRDPHRYYEAQKAVDEIHKFLLETLEDSKDYAEEYSEDLCEEIKRKKKIEWTNSFIRATGMVLGGAGGVLLGREFADHLGKMLEDKKHSHSSAPDLGKKPTGPDGHSPFFKDNVSVHATTEQQAAISSGGKGHSFSSPSHHSPAPAENSVIAHKTAPAGQQHSGTEKVEINGKMYEAKVAGEVTPSPKAVPEPPVSLHLRSGDSLWTAAEKYLRASKKHFSSLGKTPAQREALQTYNIDRLKDKIVSLIKHGNPEELKKYGLDGIHNPDNLTLAQLKRIKFSELAQSVFGHGHHLTEHLSAAQVKSIDHHNEILRNYFQHHPRASRSSAHYEEILRASNGQEKFIHHITTASGKAAKKSFSVPEKNNIVFLSKKLPILKNFSRLPTAEQYHLIKKLRWQKMALSQELQNALHQHNKLLAEKIFQQMQHLNKVEHNLWNVYQGEHQHEISRYYFLEKLFDQKRQKLQGKAAEIVNQELGKKYLGHKSWFAWKRMHRPLFFWNKDRWQNILKLDAHKVFFNPYYRLQHKNLLPEDFSNDLIYKIKAAVGEPRPGETIKEYLQRFEAQRLFSHSDMPKLHHQLYNLTKKLGWLDDKAKVKFSLDKFNPPPTNTGEAANGTKLIVIE